MNSISLSLLMGRYSGQVLPLLTLLLILDNSCICFCRNSTFFCREQERETLLQLKQSLRDPYHLLSSWKGQDCCRWEGVTCDRAYGHILELQLSRDTEDEAQMLILAGELNSSLLRLRYLNRLDLSGIDFNLQQIPEFFGSMKQLRYLNLSFANFNGTVPRQLGNLSRLEVLDLRRDSGELVVDDTLWISYLRSLKYLDMSGSIIVKARGLLQVISTLSSLSHLSLSNCGLHNFHLSSNHLVNSTSLVHLQYLDLSENDFEGPIPRTIFQNMTSLQHLDLSLNNFNSSVPMWFDMFASLVHLNLEENSFDSIEGGLFSFLKNKQHLMSLSLGGNQIREEISTTQGNSSGLIKTSLKSLDIRENHLKGALPNWLVHFTNLKHILLYDNSFSGPIPSVIGSLSNLETLDLSNNGLNGSIPSSLGLLSSLRWLGLSDNQLVGHIPESLGLLSSLRWLGLSDNQLLGHIPESLGKLRAIQSLHLERNHLEGVISEIHLSNLSRLEHLDISDNNNLTFEAKTNWIPPFQLKIIGMRSCKFGTTFPQWIRTQVEAEEITLSNASLFGALPKWLANLTASWLDLSYNRFTGPLPNISSDCSSLFLSDNLISGSLPTNIGVKVLDLSYNSISGSLPTNIGVMYQLEALYLNDNLINGTIPSSLWDMELLHLHLANNKLSGSIPDCWKGSSIGCGLPLITLHLNGNCLNGELPLFLGNCTILEVLDLGENNFFGTIPTWFNESLQSLSILRLRENTFTGSIPPQLCSLSGLQILDMARNNLTGAIPRCLGNMSSMKNIYRDSMAFRYSDDVVEITKGRYNDYTRIDLLLMVNLDLSSNNLIGSIPEELTLLSGLHGLNLSHNHLSGDIPKGIGNMTSLESLDLSYNSLSGTIPQGISALTYLAHLNLSQNNLTGQIPKGNQIQVLDDPSIYAGNPLLCGDLLRRKCLGAEVPQASKIPHPEDTHQEDKLEKALFYAIVMVGFGTGFWGFFAVLQFKKDWRRALFSFVDQVMDKAYVAIAVKVNKLKRLRQSRSA